ncbi:hypothetical protein LSAT2_031912 [Lamellibrachia satsuma]|nr:hypothetical protein LSAT2_031912 [Lamellibrachia satsuma]
MLTITPEVASLGVPPPHQKLEGDDEAICGCTTLRRNQLWTAAAMLVSFLLLTAVVSRTAEDDIRNDGTSTQRSHSASWPGIGPTLAPDTGPTSISGTGSKSTPDNGSKSTTHRRRDIVITTTTRAHTTTTRAHTTTTRVHATTTPAHTTTTWQNITTTEGNSILIVCTFFFFSAPLLLLLYCTFKSKLKRVDNDTSTDQEVESPNNVRVDTPSDLEIASGSGLGLVRISEASLYTEETPPPYESTVLAEDSLPSYYDALAMSSPNCQMPALLPAPSVNGVVPRQLSSGPISTNDTTSGPVPTHLTN